LHLAEVTATNFRTFGAAPEGDAEGGRQGLHIQLNRGMSILVGENDSGKSAIVDAIRLCLSTTSNEYNRITPEDFHCHEGEQAGTFTISCKFENLTTEDEAAFLELLTVENSKSSLYVTLVATRLPELGPNRVSVVVRSGSAADGPPIEGHAREVLRATYLRPLRDAENELRPGRASRLSQILKSYPEMQGQDEDDFDVSSDTAETLVGILTRTAHHLQRNAAIAKAEEDLNTNYLAHFQIGNDTLDSAIGVLSDTTLGSVLERLELAYTEDPIAGRRTRRGLGYNNALFMAAELLLLGSSPGALLLIEEPEAHLHPQLQSRVMELLVSKAAAVDGVQIVITTHSPNIASSREASQLLKATQRPCYCPHLRKLPAAPLAAVVLASST
jgi:putative ATP-dependent endonuclease of OLD family